MFKHVLTLKCNRKCEYCIMKNVPKSFGMECGLDDIERFYAKVSKTEKEIMLTGGEPTLSSSFGDVIYLADRYFSKVFVTTQNSKMLTHQYHGLDAITFSIHDSSIPEVKVSTPVYASILDRAYFEGMETILRESGFSGLTVNEEQREGSLVFDRIVNHLGSVKNFSIKINSREHCHGTRIVFPNLQETTEFTEKYL
jgi:organic radical activating enzyme